MLIYTKFEPAAAFCGTTETALPAFIEACEAWAALYGDNIIAQQYVDFLLINDVCLSRWASPPSGPLYDAARVAQNRHREIYAGQEAAWVRHCIGPERVAEIEARVARGY